MLPKNFKAGILELITIIINPKNIPNRAYKLSTKKTDIMNNNTAIILLRGSNLWIQELVL